MKWIMGAIGCAVAGICVVQAGDASPWAMGAEIAGVLAVAAFLS